MTTTTHRMLSHFARKCYYVWQAKPSRHDPSRHCLAPIARALTTSGVWLFGTPAARELTLPLQAMVKVTEKAVLEPDTVAWARWFWGGEIQGDADLPTERHRLLRP